jgi:pimeloyl-ACP methyl ester carboxylesterase
VARRDGWDIWFDVHGADGPPVVLLSGAALQAILWEPEWFAPLLDAGYRVVRIDWRDMGLSTWGDFRERPYRLADLARDVPAVLDAAGIEQAHVVGFSMGGIVAQLVAVLHPERLASLTTLAAGFAGGMRLMDTPKSEAVYGYLTGPRPAPDELASWLVGQWRIAAGRGFVFDEDEWEARVGRWMARGQNPRCPHMRIPAYEQRLADPAMASEAITAALGAVAVPTLVVNGDDDGTFTPVNAELIAATVPGARHVVLPGRGHDLFCDPTGEITGLLLDHLAAIGA